ncbi:MAG: hypothetical protein FWF43_10025 [Propionibacteriaceae bacterium]|nr:hypothetical protein [Propionibacteriaceae bacterium]
MADKDQECPNCGSSNTVKITYGLVTFDDELMEDLEANRVVLGGCMIFEGYSPERHCNDCGEDFGHVQ